MKKGDLEGVASLGFSRCVWTLDFTESRICLLRMKKWNILYCVGLDTWMMQLVIGWGRVLGGEMFEG